MDKLNRSNIRIYGESIEMGIIKCRACVENVPEVEWMGIIK